MNLWIDEAEIENDKQSLEDGENLVYVSFGSWNHTHNLLERISENFLIEKYNANCFDVNNDETDFLDLVDEIHTSNKSLILIYGIENLNRNQIHRLNFLFRITDSSFEYSNIITLLSFSNDFLLNISNDNENNLLVSNNDNQIVLENNWKNNLALKLNEPTEFFNGFAFAGRISRASIENSENKNINISDDANNNNINNNKHNISNDNTYNNNTQKNFKTNHDRNVVEDFKLLEKYCIDLKTSNNFFKNQNLQERDSSLLNIKTEKNFFLKNLFIVFFGFLLFLIFLVSYRKKYKIIRTSSNNNNNNKNNNNNNNNNNIENDNNINIINNNLNIKNTDIIINNDINLEGGNIDSIIVFDEKLTIDNKNSNKHKTENEIILINKNEININKINLKNDNNDIKNQIPNNKEEKFWFELLEEQNNNNKILNKNSNSNKTPVSKKTIKKTNKITNRIEERKSNIITRSKSAKKIN
jgi:hypothetical protein